MLMFGQESMFYLTVYNTTRYCFFQCMYLGVNLAMPQGETMLMTDPGNGCLSRSTLNLVVK